MLAVPDNLIDLVPDRTKVFPFGGGPPMKVKLTGGILCFGHWFGSTLAAYESQGMPITNFLTRICSRDKHSFDESPVSSSDLQNRIKLHFQAAGQYAGHTTHGSRRGKMQHCVYNLGLSVQEASAAAQIKTPAVAALYLDQQRHLSLHGD